MRLNQLKILVFTGLVLMKWSWATNPHVSREDEYLAKLAQNPVADIFSIPFQNNSYFNYNAYNRTQNILNIQPIIPFELTSHFNLITRTILPVRHQPEILSARTHDGIGELNPSFLVVPRKTKKVIWGLGPTFLIPTANHPLLGTGKWSTGPATVLVINSGKWVSGFIASNLWSFAGDRNRTSVSFLSFQYFINYNLTKGWYLTSAPIITSNWRQAAHQRWTVPFGGGVGRTFLLGSQAMNLNLQYFYNAKKPDAIRTESSIRFVVQLLFIKGL